MSEFSDYLKAKRQQLGIADETKANEPKGKSSGKNELSSYLASKRQAKPAPSLINEPKSSSQSDEELGINEPLQQASLYPGGVPSNQDEVQRAFDEKAQRERLRRTFGGNATPEDLQRLQASTTANNPIAQDPLSQIAIATGMGMGAGAAAGGLASSAGAGPVASRMLAGGIGGGVSQAVSGGDLGDVGFATFLGAAIPGAAAALGKARNAATALKASQIGTENATAQIADAEKALADAKTVGNKSLEQIAQSRLQSAQADLAKYNSMKPTRATPSIAPLIKKGAAIAAGGTLLHHFLKP